MTDTSKPELLPCPFCGGEAEKLKSASLKGRPVWETGCKSMFCVAMSRNSKKRLVEDWNTRAAKDAVIAELVGALEDMLFLAEAEHVCLLSWNQTGSAANYDGITRKAKSALSHAKQGGGNG